MTYSHRFSTDKMRGLRLALLMLVILSQFAQAQREEANLSEKEVEALRDSAYVPDDRMFVFIKLLDLRANSIEGLFGRERTPGREQDAHDLFEQFTALANELEDNLDDYGPRHRDVRKSLPKLVQATERWATQLKAAPTDDRYALSQKLALEAVRDIREESSKMVEEQRAWFASHPKTKDNSVAPELTPR